MAKYLVAGQASHLSASKLIEEREYHAKCSLYFVVAVGV
jgi:hypothetical protein